MHIDTYNNLLLLTGNKQNMLKLNYKLHCILSACLLGIASSTCLASDQETAYVDSVYGWGAWELGLEPAAGGPSPSPSRTVTAVEPNVQFRPNENSAFSPNSRAVVTTTTRPTPIPVSPPSLPPSAPITITSTPGQPVPTGSPVGNFF